MNQFNQMHSRFIRDSRHAFDGSRFQVEKPARDWTWGIILMIIVAGSFAAEYLS